MNYRIIPAAILTLALPLSATASTWVEVAYSNAVVVYADKDSIRRSGTNVKVWLKWVWNSPQEVLGSVPQKYFLMQRQLNVYNCPKETYSIVQETFFSDTGGEKVVNRYTIEEKNWQFEESAPDTIGDSLQKFACKPATKPATKK